MEPAELRTARRALGLSANRFAELGAQFGQKIAFDGSTVRAWEREKVPPPIALLVEMMLRSDAVRVLLGIPGFDPRHLSAAMRRRLGITLANSGK